MNKTAQDYIDEFNKDLDKCGERLINSLNFHKGFYGNKKSLRRAYAVDEEEGFMQALDDALRREGKSFESLDEGLIQVLNRWINDRACYPLEWVKQIIKRVIMHERSY